MRIVIIDDSKDAITLIRNRLGEESVTYLPITYTVLDPDIRGKISAFKPDLLITDLVLENDREEGIALVRDIQKDPRLSGIPIVIISKLINESPLGQKLGLQCSALPGVRGAYGKLKVPSLSELQLLVGEGNA